MTTARVPPAAVKRFNMMVGRVVSGLDEKYAGRIVCMGDFNSLADVDNDGMGLINGVVSEENLVSIVLDQGLVDWFRVLHPSMKAVSFGGNQGSYSRIDYMLGGCGLDGVRMCYVPRADGPLSDHALLLDDVKRLGQLKHVLRRKDCGKVELKEAEDTIADMRADGVDDPEVLEVTSKILTGLLAHMDQVKGGMDLRKRWGNGGPFDWFAAD